ncbi:MAG: efflux RND transporter periplasmic adaptor subunit [Desulfovibrionales bacterium]
MTEDKENRREIILLRRDLLLPDYRMVLFLFPVVLVLLAWGCGREEPRQERDRAVAVEVVEVRSSDFARTVRGIGTTEAAETVQVSPERSGVITQIHVQEGERVRQGQPLFSLRSAVLRQELEATRAALNSARSRLENARSSFRRFSRLYEQEIVSKEEFEETKTDFETARAEVNRLEAEVRLVQERLDETYVRAPMDGVLSETEFDPGDYVNEGDPLITLFRVDILEVAFTVSERYMGQVEIGQPVRVKVDAYPEKEFPGEVIFISPNIDPQTRSFRVKAAVENPDDVLKPGAFAPVILLLDVHENRPTVPEEALVAVRAGYMVFVIEQEKAWSRDVSIGLREPGRVEVTSGLQVGDLVVSAGQMALAHGSRIRIMNQEGGPENTPPEESR